MSDDFGLRGPKLPWACPNDRQLALRAKLQTGWSIKTNQFSQYPKPPPLTEREQQIIVSVVKKAEEVDLNEQHRVGKLVDRLESLRKLANGNGVTECVLCGDTFGFYVFGRSNYKCHDCQKAVCRKCVVEISSSKVGIVTASGREIVIRLCKVCSENRELIKKSGAWFFRGVPKYILPEKKNHYTNTYEKYAASPRYQEQKYVSRYIHPSDEPSSSTNSGSSSSGGAACSSAAASSSSGATGASSMASAMASSSTTATSAATAIGTTSSTTSSGSGSSNNNSSTSRPMGFFWSRSLQNRSTSSQPSSVVDQDESSSGDELCGASSSHLLKSSAVTAASVAGGTSMAGSTVATIRHLFGSRKGKSSLATSEVTATSASSSTANSNNNGGGASGGNGGNGTGGGWSGMSLSRGHSPPVSRFLLQRNTSASSSLRSNVGSPVPPGTSAIPSSATTTSNTPNEHEQFSTCEQVTPGPSGMTEYSYASSSHDLLSASSSFRKKSYERIDFSVSREAILKSDSQHHGDGAASTSTSSRTAASTDNNHPKPSTSSSNEGLFPPSGSSSTVTTQSMYKSTPSVTSSTASASSSNNQQQGQTSSSTPLSPLGIIQVALLYDDSHQALHCSVLHAKDLTPTDINGLADPYCILKLIPSRFEGTHLRTKTIHKSVNPVFNETLTFYGVTQHDLTWQTLQILVMDDDRWGKDCLGTAQIPLHRIRSQQTRCFAQPLERGRLSEEKDWGRGRLLLSLTYMTEKSLLLVGVIQAQDLPALDHNGTSDPFVKVRLLHDTNLGALSTSCFSSSSINRKFRTSVKWRTLNPIFQEEFSLKVSIVDLPRLALVISVWDKDLGKNDDYIGGIVLSTGSKGERLKHWLDTMKLPNTKHFKWHTLSPSVLPSH